MAFIEVNDITKHYGVKDTLIKALDGVSFNLEKNEMVVILGASGAGKSTLLNILGGMDSATSGRYFVGGKEVTSYKDRELALFIRQHVGLVFDFYNLITNF